MQLVSATANPDKFIEIVEILPAQIELLPRPTDIPDVVEDADDLAGNARLKANAIMEATGLATIADDTGLEVDALQGAPGVHSARFAGDSATYEENVAKLLKNLEAVAIENRTARFRTVVLIVWPDGNETIAHGVVEGRITENPIGELGFGYDAVFCPNEGRGKTFGEMTNSEKNLISHRGKALRSLSEKLGLRS
ncbi:MAG: non-canonical purine NTP pyrophosphatase, RdgB/HAM1 family [Acidimicrobiaceae bacterium]|nr:non-canonical purine NTP pyrophosphatase, RdgB/HAM1 family [Acidimicrobiaceae bacterium]